MEEILKFVSQLPLPAAVAFSGVSALVFWVARLGILEGRKLPPAHDAPTAQVAAVIVDPTALNAATVALGRHTEALDRQTDMQERVLERVSVELERLREEIRELSREISRRN